MKLVGAARFRQCLPDSTKGPSSVGSSVPSFPPCKGKGPARPLFAESQSTVTPIFGLEESEESDFPGRRSLLLPFLSLSPPLSRSLACCALATPAIFILASLKPRHQAQAGNLQPTAHAPLLDPKPPLCFFSRASSSLLLVRTQHRCNSSRVVVGCSCSLGPRIGSQQRTRVLARILLSCTVS